MQCASSITTRPADRLSSGSTWSRNDGLFSRSGLTSSTSACPAATSAYSASHSAVLAELMVRARMPARSAAPTWLRMSASSGDTITVGPAPRARSRAVATKYTADLPQPVRCTTSARRRSATRARIAVHWSSRSRACSPASARRHVSASSRSSASSSVMPYCYQALPSASPHPVCHTRGKHRISPGGTGRRRHGLAVTDEAIEKIKAMITSGALRAGDRLPREADLAADLGLSRSSLREAVRALSLVNILDVRRGDGTYVTSLEPRLLLEALSFIVDFHRDDTLLEFLRVRRILEPAATAMAAERITAEESGGLRALLDSIGPDPAAEELVANDLEFHRRIVACSGNSVLSSLLESMSGPTTRARVWRGLTQAGARAQTLAEHRAILDALATHEPEVARSWATVHIAGVEQWLASVP